MLPLGAGSRGQLKIRLPQGITSSSLVSGTEKTGKWGDPGPLSLLNGLQLSGVLAASRATSHDEPGGRVPYQRRPARRPLRGSVLLVCPDSLID